jgi:phenylacetate-CoA ligase
MKGIEDILYPLKKHYENSPLFLQSMLGGIYRSIPLKYRVGESYFEFKNLLKNNSWDPNFVKNYQNEEFLKTIEVAKKTTFYPRFYKENGCDINDIKSIDDIQKIPFLEKHHLQEFREEMVNLEEVGKSLYLTTGGSTGTPTGFYYEKGVTRSKEQAFIEDLWAQQGYKNGDKCVVIRGGVISSDSDSNKFDKYDAIRNWLIMSSYHLNEDTFRKYIERINQFKSKFIQGYPSALTMLAKFMNANNVKLKVKIKGIFAGSENIFPHQIEEIEKAFDAKVMTWYGHTEVLILGGYCNYDNVYHMYPQYGATEMIDANGNPVETGEGELVGTGFHNNVMPLIRFKTGDIAQVSDKKECSCNKNHIFIARILGRSHEFILSPSNRKISLTAINMHDDVFANIKQYQFEQFEKSEVYFRYELVNPVEDINESIIVKALSKKLGNDILLKVEKVAKIEPTKRGKLKALIQHINE